jgi:serine/threonine-protein kinase RsbW
VGANQMSGATSAEPTCITLSFPAAAEHIRLARLVASGLVATLDYGLDDVEDLRIAVDELCAVILAHTEPAATIVVHFEVAGAGVIVRAAAPARADLAEEAGVEVDELSRLILLAAADEHEVSRLDGQVVARLSKHPAVADG